MTMVIAIDNVRILVAHLHWVAGGLTKTKMTKYYLL